MKSSLYMPRNAIYPPNRSFFQSAKLFSNTSEPCNDPVAFGTEPQDQETEIYGNTFPTYTAFADVLYDPETTAKTTKAKQRQKQQIT